MYIRLTRMDDQWPSVCEFECVHVSRNGRLTSLYFKRYSYVYVCLVNALGKAKASNVFIFGIVSMSHDDGQKRG